MRDKTVINGARQHNLKNVSLEIPKNALVVLTGLSGSGKSTLAFDTLHPEGQRQYLESLGLVTDRVSRPQFDAVEGLSPSISVEQQLANRSPRSTVGTATEVYTYLRVLFARLGRRPCPACGASLPPSNAVAGTDPLSLEEGAGDEVEAETFPCPGCGAAVPEIGMTHFSFNKPAGACPQCTGLGVVNLPDLGRLIDWDLSIADGAVRMWERYHRERFAEILRLAGRHYGFGFEPEVPLKDLPEAARDLLLHGVDGEVFRRHFPEVAPPETAGRGRFEGVLANLMRRYEEQKGESAYTQAVERFIVKRVCPDCGGDRIRKESRQVTVAGRSIVELSKLPLSELQGWLEELARTVEPESAAIYEPIVADLRERIRRLVDVGVGYLTMERASPTLSAGEAQRLRLAALLGSGLTGVLYVLDEPTTGLHPRDTERLVTTLKRLRDLGNTVLVIEHDHELMRAADFLVDIGPGAGRAGGHVVVAGPPQQVAACRESVTGNFLSGRAFIEAPPQRRRGNGKSLVVRGARAYNLKNLTVRLPLGALVALTGVSGSGKSTLLFDLVERAARQRFYGASEPPGEHDAIEGWEALDKVVAIDQASIGRTPRSNAATYAEAFAPIRDAFAATSDARARGLSSRAFSFNVAGGRCERCQGAGTLTVEMHFLPDVEVRCPACRGRRFKPETLAVRCRERSIADVLDMTVEEASELFVDEPPIRSRLGLLRDVGLGYLQLGQPATTLSGGEAQRVKLSKELARRSTGRTLYLLDEPTTGLHTADVGRLLSVLQRLVDAGNSVIVIEHNLDVIRSADWLVDFGPEGGIGGGRILGEGTPEAIAQLESSWTGKALRECGPGTGGAGGGFE